MSEFVTIKVLLLSPLGTVTSKYGEVSKVHPHGHNGIDYSSPIGTELHSPVDGIVMRTVDQGDVGLGKGIFIKTQDGYQYIFGHLSKVLKGKGEIVHSGDIIGLSGNTGHSTGPHVHVGLKDRLGHYINPESMMRLKRSFIDLKDNAVEAFVNLPI